jgi:peptide/nickel transport system ATP-binding protein
MTASGTSPVQPDPVRDDAPLLEVTDLTIRFGHSHRLAVDHVNLRLGPHERLGLIGESGSGKSVTALAIMGLLPDNANLSGHIRFQGQDLLAMSDRQLSQLRGRDLSMVFQEPMTALDPTMKVGRQVAEVLKLHTRVSGATTRQRVLARLEQVGLPTPAALAEAFPHELSGGQRQRVVLAMALMNQPRLIICDEPTTALDVTTQAQVLRLLDQALTAEQAACLFISHDLAVVAQVCQQVAVMLDGRIVETGPVSQVLARPEHPYTQGLIATARLDQATPGSRLSTVEDFYQVGSPALTGELPDEPGQVV